ncbi:unnamed protein product [Medioppia subpectinata]|uniref:Glycoside hydrolase family 31 TIM barrel domain-containing protein n=1 Tax=Medioppia subpectinata TaxID=1979941 RepID=A0A7R9KNN8_9ACAR|nr:unnamed protein product [Medioppia subpectinata]CAG2106947.1 unnamed protein product [Medioppia subpectinata]
MYEKHIPVRSCPESIHSCSCPVPVTNAKIFSGPVLSGTGHAKIDSGLVLFLYRIRKIQDSGLYLQRLTWPIFTKDNAPETNDEKNNYGQHPFYTVLESNGNSHGILLLNSNAMEYTLMPAPAMSVKTIGGILDFFVFIGDNPEHVIQLYTSLIGRTFMPSFWAFGFQLSKWNYKDLNEVKATVERQIKHQIPYVRPDCH